jgi:16S rRNA (guanine527-N7)-methyltransferase
MTPGEQVIDIEVDRLLARYDPERRLAKFWRLLLAENKRCNLVSRETSLPDLRRLSAESVLPMELVGSITGDYLDIGSGGGLPALPILISGRIGGRTLLLERTRKKAAALNRILTAMEITAEVGTGSFEETAFDRTFALVTMRLVKLTAPLLARIAPLLAERGVFVYYGSTELKEDSLTARAITYRASQSTGTRGLTIFEKSPAVR